MNGQVRRIIWAEYPRAEIGTTVLNPMCGMYSIYRFFVDNEDAQGDGTPSENNALRDDQTLCLVEINLCDYADAPLSDEALMNVEHILRRFIRGGKMMILRFLYDWDGHCIQTEPKQLTTILNHMQQLSPLLKAYTAWIYILQGLFIGNWGEMHNSRYLSPTALCDLSDSLSELVGEKTFMAVRSPAHWRVVARSFDPIDRSEAYSARNASRIGLFNDGMLASYTDYGTYGTVERSQAQEHGDRMKREDELTFQSRLCRYVPNGGEVVNPCAQNDYAQAVRDLKTMCVSYLNSQYDLNVLEKWHRTPLNHKRGVWSGGTGLQYIAGHLGYRYIVSEVRLVVARQNTLHATVTIRNDGFSVCYRRLEVSLTVRDVQTAQRHVFGVETDSRFWFPDNSVTLEVDMDAGEWIGRNMLLCLCLTEPVSGQHVQLANGFTMIASDGDNLLGAFTAKD